MFWGDGVGISGVKGFQPLLDGIQSSGSVEEGWLRMARCVGLCGGGAYRPLGPCLVQRGHRIVIGYGATTDLRDIIAGGNKGMKRKQRLSVDVTLR